ncbi:MAG: hypothetical protein ACI9T7_000073 [Oleiphilaceae bacterium]|jgi:hypothetical protein
MKIITALILVAAGIWIAYNMPDIADVAIEYIDMAVEFCKSMLKKLDE